MGIFFSKKPNFSKLKARLDVLKKISFLKLLNDCGARGVLYLRNNTPRDSGNTANAWEYSIIKKGDFYRLVFSNSVKAGKTQLVILLQYGHGTRNGGYVYGRDFINPALRKTFDELKTQIISEVKNA